MRQEKLQSGDGPMACNYKHTMFVYCLLSFLLRFSFSVSFRVLFSQILVNMRNAE